MYAAILYINVCESKTELNHYKQNCITIVCFDRYSYVNIGIILCKVHVATCL